MHRISWVLPLAVLGCQSVTAGAAAPSVQQTGSSCPALSTELERCASCAPAETRQAQQALASCRGGCPPLQAATSAVVPPSLHGMALGAPLETAEQSCQASGGQWQAPDRCRHGRGPWGLVADWELSAYEGRITRVEMLFSPDRCQGDIDQLGQHVAQLVTHAWGAPTYLADGHYAWMPPQGAYWAVLRDQTQGVVRLWVKHQL